MRAWILALLLLPGCSVIREYPRRSQLTLQARAINGANEPERSTEIAMTLNGNNRDVLRAYMTGMEFTLEKLGLIKH